MKDIELMREDMKAFKTHLEYIKQALERNNKEHEDIIVKIDKFIDSADEKFASKLTEKIVYGLAGTMLIYILSQILSV